MLYIATRLQPRRSIGWQSAKPFLFSLSLGARITISMCLERQLLPLHFVDEHPFINLTADNPAISSQNGVDTPSLRPAKI